MNYTTEKSLPEAVSKERKFTEFFRSVKALTRNLKITESEQRWNPTDEALSAALTKAIKVVRISLCDSFDTPTAVNELCELVCKTNTYFQLPQD